MYCSKCGQKNVTGANFCERCRKPLIEEKSSSRGPLTSQPQKEEKPWSSQPSRSTRPSQITRPSQPIKSQKEEKQQKAKEKQSHIVRNIFIFCIILFVLSYFIPDNEGSDQGSNGICDSYDQLIDYYFEYYEEDAPEEIISLFYPPYIETLRSDGESELNIVLNVDGCCDSYGTSISDWRVDDFMIADTPHKGVLDAPEILEIYVIDVRSYRDDNDTTGTVFHFAVIETETNWYLWRVCY